ncbi:MAG TPA: bacillithiol biosynthesis cysteine-adding enzyme BshC, partial [Bacillota bacterium]
MQSTWQSLDDAAALLPPLLRDLYRRFDDVAPFFEYNPFDPASFQRRAAWLDARDGSHRAAVAEALVEANRGYGADEAAQRNAAALADPGTLAVVTGQQAGLFGGPLHTLYKAVTAIRLAGELSQRLERRVVPVFWMASEDHDYDEVRRAYLLDQAGRVRELALPPRTGPRASVGALPVPRRVRGLLREVAQALGPRARHPEFLDQALEELDAARDWGDWFARLMARWLSAHGLIILDPMLRPLRLPLREFYPLALVRREGVHRELAAAASRLQRRGYPVQLEVERDHCNLFYLADGERVALHWRDAQLVGRGGQVRLGVGEGTALMRREPWRFSPNVVLRPLVQDLLLPTLAYVAGPAETAYLAQLRDVYPLFGLQMPVVVPRLSVTLVAPEVGARLRDH